MSADPRDAETSPILLDLERAAAERRELDDVAAAGARAERFAVRTERMVAAARRENELNRIIRIAAPKGGLATDPLALTAAVRVLKRLVIDAGLVRNLDGTPTTDHDDAGTELATQIAEARCEVIQGAVDAARGATGNGN